jgi:purine nucleoside permease
MTLRSSDTVVSRYRVPRLILAVLFFAGATVAAGAAIPVKMVVIANFENGQDMGDKPGEFQFWVEREHLTETIAVRGTTRPVRHNAQGLYGLLLENLTPFLLDTRFDFSKTYWLFTGISGVDPEVASVGSAAWARWVINGDELREIDDREIPAGWPYGLFAIGAQKPNMLPVDPNSFGSAESADDLAMAYPLNQGLAQWAFAMTKDVAIPDTPALQQQREAWKGYPNAQRPPFVLMGETLGSVRYWHGPKRTQWAQAHAVGPRLGQVVDSRQGDVCHDQHGKPDGGPGRTIVRQVGVCRSPTRPGVANGQQSFRSPARQRCIVDDRRRGAGASGGV